METSKQIFETAKQDFGSQLSERQANRLGHITRTQLQHVKIQISKIQHDQAGRKSMMNFNRYRHFIEAFEQFDDVCKAVEIEVEDLSGYLWGPCWWILNIIKEEPKVLDCVLEWYFKLGQRLPLVSQYKSQIRERPAMTKILAWIYHDLLQFHAKILRLLETSSWKKTFVVNWKDHKRAFEAILHTFDRHTNILKQLLDNQQYQNLENLQTLQNRTLQQAQDSFHRMNDHILRYQDDRDEILQHIALYEQDRENVISHAREQEQQWKDDQYRNVIDWLRSPGDTESAAAYHEEFRKMHAAYPNTGKWIFCEDKIESWINDEPPTHSVLWINGKKGAGKTILASVLIEHLMEEKKEFKTSYFYCRETNERQGETRFLAICKSLLRQLTNYNRDLLPTLHEKRMNGVENINEEATAKSLIELFSDTSMKQFIIIDGLDELHEIQRKNLVSFLTSVVARSDTDEPGKIRLLLISTDLSDMRKLVQADDNVQVYDINPQDTEKDIREYVKTRFVQIKSDFGLLDNEVEVARHVICRNANGMFLYAYLVVENLMTQPNISYLMSELKEENIPMGLSEAYRKIIKKLQDPRTPNVWKEARKVFGWLACAQRPLKWHELQAILSMKVEQNGQTKIDFRLHRLCKDIQTVCGPLVYVVGGNRIEFIHQTAKEFIMQNEELDRRALECELTFLCLSYLSHGCFSNDLGETQRQYNAEFGYYTFQDYAISMWSFHLKSIIEKCTDLLGDRTRDTHRMAIRVVQQFYLKYERGLQAPPGDQDETTIKQETHVSDARTHCQKLEQHPDLFGWLVQICTHINRHHAQKIKERNQVSIKDLKEALEKNRVAIRTIANNEDLKAKVLKHYGDKYYKCSRVNCVYFYEGLDDEERLKKHSDRHERPYSCPDPTCYMVPFGFSSNKDVDKHLTVYHPQLADQLAAFPQPVARKAKFQCQLCHKSFTRGAILRQHMDGSHLGRRPYPCSACGKEFTRQNDRRRHEKTLHVRRR